MVWALKVEAVLLFHLQRKKSHKVGKGGRWIWSTAYLPNSDWTPPRSWHLPTAVLRLPQTIGTFWFYFIGPGSWSVQTQARPGCGAGESSLESITRKVCSLCGGEAGSSQDIVKIKARGTRWGKKVESSAERCFFSSISGDRIERLFWDGGRKKKEQSGAGEELSGRRHQTAGFLSQSRVNTEASVASVQSSRFKSHFI